MQSPSSSTELVSSLDAEVTSGSLDASNTTLLVVAATVLCAENNLESALRVLHASDELECYAMRIQVRAPCMLMKKCSSKFEVLDCAYFDMKSFSLLSDFA